jgi:hypothetical protein
MAGLEYSLYGYLRGLEGNPASTIGGIIFFTALHRPEWMCA